LPQSAAFHQKWHDSDMNAPTLYGIPNCDTVKKARAWLTEHGVAYQFHDFKKQSVPTELLPEWINSVGLDKLINRKGPTWRKLDAAAQASVMDAASAAPVILEHASVVKRPLVVWGDGSVTVGFSDGLFAQQIRQSHPG
jgi:Spx/MgsR family transcriptional regulator